MTQNHTWILPDGVEELLPPQANLADQLRSQCLSVFRHWGYQLVIPPLIEYLDSLLTGVGHDLESLTFKVTDYHSGRLMGVRADMTPQVARVDANFMHNQGVARLCYADHVLNTRAQSPLSSRCPFQVGAELFGHAGLASDQEVLCLMVQALTTCGIDSPIVDLSHVGIFDGVVEAAGLDESQSHQLLDILQRKSIPELTDFVGVINKPELAELLLELPHLYGGQEVFARAQNLLGACQLDDASAACKYLQDLFIALQKRLPEVQLNIDLSELRGYQYHTGVIFAAYTQGHGEAIAKGGRYDNIGAAFGNSRPATGFSLDLKKLVNLLPAAMTPSELIFAPATDDEALLKKIATLRAENAVIQALDADDEIVLKARCTHFLVQKEHGHWQVEAKKPEH